jgi:hypothetical protein
MNLLRSPTLRDNGEGSTLVLQLNMKRFGRCRPNPVVAGARWPSVRDRVVDALDVEFHAEDLRIGQMVAALALDFLAVLMGHLNGTSLPSVIAAWVSIASFITSSGIFV